MAVPLIQSDCIQSELERIVRSREFAASPRLISLLRYCIEQSRAGRLDSLKESIIGVNVFGRDPDYDPKIDPIVRVHARRLREKLNAFYDSEGSLDIVVQIPKGGYVARFEEAPARQTPVPTPARRGPLPAALLICAAALLLIAIALVWRAARRNAAMPTPQALVSLPGSAGDPAWSPDGASIAFTWDGGEPGPRSVYVLKTGQTVPRKLTASKDPEYRPVWSPDRTAIALLRGGAGNRFAIVLVDLWTGSERVIRSVAGSSWGPILPALDWSPSGEWLVTSEQSPEPAEPAHLLLISPKAGSSSVITDPPNGSRGDLEARFTPDSKRILFRRGGHGELFILSLNGTAASMPTEVTHDNAGIRGIAVSQDGKTIYFGGQREYSRFGIWRIRESDPAPLRITPEGMEAISPAIDPLGRFLAFVQSVADLNLWLYDARSAQARRGSADERENPGRGVVRDSQESPGQPRLMAPSTQAEYSPAFSPDGQKLAFVSDRSGAADIWISPVNGGEPRKLTSLQPGEIPTWPSWSPDGTRIAFFSRWKGVNYAYETDVATGATRPLKAGDDYALFPQYSADGRSLYYVSNAGHRFRIWRQPLAPRAGAEPVVAGDVRVFRMSKDRRYLYFLQSGPQSSPQSNNAQRLIQLNLATKEEKPVWTFADSLAAFDAWDIAGGELFYVGIEPERSVPQLWAVDLKTGQRRALGLLRKLSNDWQTGIAASPDGQSVVASQVDSDDAKLMLLRLVQ